jgi:hypothetical protein
MEEYDVMLQDVRQEADRFIQVRTCLIDARCFALLLRGTMA